MEHDEQLKRVITALQAMADDATKSALVMTCDGVANHTVGEVHILSAGVTPYPRLVGMLAACVQGAAGVTKLSSEQILVDVANSLDNRRIATDDSETIH